VLQGNQDEADDAISVCMNTHTATNSPTVWPSIYLASSSPRRRDLLLQLGVSFTPLVIEIDEHWDGFEAARHYVQRLAREKAQAGRAMLGDRQPLPVLGADTSVVLDDRILGKAESDSSAAAMLERLAGRCHRVISSVAVVTPEGSVHEATSQSQVYLRPLTCAEIKAYCASGEPLGKAGGYAIQGRAAAFVDRIEGSYSGIVGLPLVETADLLQALGRGVREC
jgi:septum formation protein